MARKSKQEAEESWRLMLAKLEQGAHERKERERHNRVRRLVGEAMRSRRPDRDELVKRIIAEHYPNPDDYWLGRGARAPAAITPTRKPQTAPERGPPIKDPAIHALLLAILKEAEPRTISRQKARKLVQARNPDARQHDIDRVFQHTDFNKLVKRVEPK